MCKMRNLAKRWFDVAVFLLLGAGVPAITAFLFADKEYLDVLPSLYCVYIAAYVMHFPLYHRMVPRDERRWWKYLASLLWLYMALGGVWLMFQVFA